MIYVTVGKMPLGFDRLVEAADNLAAGLGERVFIQRGSSAYTPVNAEYVDFLPFGDAEEMLAEASLVISHAGIGTIIGSLRAGTPIVVFPRRHRYNEHFNDHQTEVCAAIEGRPGVDVVYEASGLGRAVRRLLGTKGAFSPATPGEGIIRAIDGFLAGFDRQP